MPDRGTEMKPEPMPATRAGTADAGTVDTGTGGLGTGDTGTAPGRGARNDGAGRGSGIICPAERLRFPSS